MINKILKDIDNEECYYVGTNGCLYQDLGKEELFAIKQEIERLQAELDKTRLSELDKEYTIESNIKTYNKLAKYSAELEDRIDKAIEKIKIYDKKGNNLCFSMELSDNLINTLKGSDKE